MTKEIVPITNRSGETSWWQRCSMAEFKTHVMAMNTQEREILASEVKGVITVIVSQLELHNADGAWRFSAKKSLALVREKKFVLLAILQNSRPPPNPIFNKRAVRNRRSENAKEARALLDAGDIVGAVGKLISFDEDWDEETKRRAKELEEK